MSLTGSELRGCIVVVGRRRKLSTVVISVNSADDVVVSILISSATVVVPAVVVLLSCIKSALDVKLLVLPRINVCEFIRLLVDVRRCDRVRLVGLVCMVVVVIKVVVSSSSLDSVVVVGSVVVVVVIVDVGNVVAGDGVMVVASTFDASCCFVTSNSLLTLLSVLTLEL